MNDNVSSFTSPIDNDTAVERLYLNGSTCDTYIVRILGKLHFKKKLKAEYKAKPQYVEAFRKEFEVGYRLEHAALPRYIVLREEDGCPYILEDYIEGETLTEFLEKHPIFFHSRSHANDFIDQLLSVVAYLHDNQVLFLDLKPDNVMITAVGRQLRLVDLGGCRADDFDRTEEATQSFSAPEQRRGVEKEACGQNVDERTDIYLIGRLLQCAGVPRIYNNVIARCLKENPEDRYASVRKLQKAVAGVRRRVRMAAAMPCIIVLACLVFYLSSNYVLERRSNAAARIESAASNGGERRDTVTDTITVVKPMDSAQSESAVYDHAKALYAKEKQRMRAELDRAMNKAFNKYLASFENDSVVSSVSYNDRISDYLHEVGPVMRRLEGEFVYVTSADIGEEYVRFYNKKIEPIDGRVEKGY